VDIPDTVASPAIQGIQEYPALRVVLQVTQDSQVIQVFLPLVLVQVATQEYPGIREYQAGQGSLATQVSQVTQVTQDSQVIQDSQVPGSPAIQATQDFLLLVLVQVATQGFQVCLATQGFQV
jgi:hypothetical protein